MLTILKDTLSKRKILITVTIVGVILITVALFAAARSNKPAQAAPRPLDVEVVQVAQQDVPVYSEWIGTTDGMVNADINAQVTGYLFRQDYKEGSFVTKGQLLFEIDPRPFQAEVRGPGTVPGLILAGQDMTDIISIMPRFRAIVTA